MVGLRDVYPKFWMSGIAALRIKLGAVKASVFELPCGLPVGDSPDG